MMGLGMPSLKVLPWILGMVATFLLGGQLIGGLKENNARKACAEVQRTIVLNAVAQAEEIAEKWEQSRRDGNKLTRRVEGLRVELDRANDAIDQKGLDEADRLEAATVELTTCLLNDDTREILNDWLVGEDGNAEGPVL